jgi:hypothetical protein
LLNQLSKTLLPLYQLAEDFSLASEKGQRLLLKVEALLETSFEGACLVSRDLNKVAFFGSVV